jgi:hypothetical protein
MVPAAVVSIGEKLRAQVGGEQRRLVAGDRALGGQRIHGLGAGDAWHQLHGEARHALVAQTTDSLVVAMGLQVADQDQAAPVLRDLLRHRRLYLDEHLRLAAQRGAVRHQAAARLGVGLIQAVARGPAAGLDQYLEALLGQPGDRLGDQGDPALPGNGFPRHAHAYRHCL